MEELIQTLKSLHSSDGIMKMLAWGGIWVLIGIIFAETGLLVGFFLPGDSLLITAGILAQPTHPNHIGAFNIWLLNVVLVLAGVIGDQVGFYLGHKTGDAIWNRPDGRFYKRKHLEEAHDFYERHGGLAIVGARFVPIFRTFVPFAAGVARMPYKAFVFWNISGGILWVTSLLWAGYFLGATKWANRLDKIIVVVVFVSVLPILFGAVKRAMKNRAAAK